MGIVYIRVCNICKQAIQEKNLIDHMLKNHMPSDFYTLVPIQNDWKEEGIKIKKK